MRKKAVQWDTRRRELDIFEINKAGSNIFLPYEGNIEDMVFSPDCCFLAVIVNDERNHRADIIVQNSENEKNMFRITARKTADIYSMATRIACKSDILMTVKDLLLPANNRFLNKTQKRNGGYSDDKLQPK